MRAARPPLQNELRRKMKTIRLGEIAYARSGDKGSSANVAVFANEDRQWSRREPSDMDGQPERVASREASDQYDLLRERLTEKVVKDFFSPLGVKKVKRYEVPNLSALNFVLDGVLAEGGSRSLRIDAQGKTLGQAILELRLSN
jgi:hypothetical protein